MRRRDTLTFLALASLAGALGARSPARPPGGAACGADCEASLYQPPRRENAQYSDASCTLCGDPQVFAEDVVLAEALEVCEVVLWGGYLFANTPPAADDFTVVVHRDDGGVPGSVVRSESGVAASRTATGLTIVPGTDQYRFALTLAEPLPLAPGTYWFEIYNDTHADDDDFGWETGDPDTATGRPGVAVAFTAPGSGWLPSSGDLAWALCGRAPAPAPSVSVWGLLGLVGVLLGSGLFLLARPRGVGRFAPLGRKSLS